MAAASNQPSRGAPTGTNISGRSTGERSPSPTPVVVAAAPGIVAPGPVVPAAVLNNVIGQVTPGVSLAAPTRLTGAVGDPKVYSAPNRTTPSTDELSSADVFVGSNWEMGAIPENSAGPGVGEPASDRAGGPLAIPDPQEAGPITDFWPFDREALESAIDRVLDRFDDLGVSLPAGSWPFHLIPASLTVATAALATHLALRLRRSRDGENELEGDAGPVPFPGLPRLRSRFQP